LEIMRAEAISKLIITRSAFDHFQIIEIIMITTREKIILS